MSCGGVHGAGCSTAGGAVLGRDIIWNGSEYDRTWFDGLGEGGTSKRVCLIVFAGSGGDGILSRQLRI